MEAALEEQILSLEELSKDLITFNLETADIESEDVFEDLALSKLQTIRNMLESNDDEDDYFNLVTEVEDVDSEEYSSESIEKLLNRIKSDVISLDYKDDIIDEPPVAVKDSTKKEPTQQKHPVKQEVIIKQELSFNSARATSLYFCPIPNCSFSTSKEGMRTSKAALHLKMEHMIRAVDMKPGMYKFNKVKV